MNPSRRDFAAAFLAAVPAFGQDPARSQLGNLYPPIQAIADASPLELSFLRPEFRDHQRWQRLAREKLIDLLHYRPAPVLPQVQLHSRKERAGFMEEDLTFLSAP